LLLMSGTARGQDDATKTEQIWLDYNPRWDLGKRWLLDLDNQTRIVVSDPALWQIRIQPTLEFSLRKWIDLTGGVWLIYTNRFEDSDRLETRPTVGLRLKRNIWRGVNLNNYIRGEYRIQRDLSDGETTAAGRLRNRLQALIPINRRSLSDDNTWYAVIDAEWFWQRDPVVDDGFNSQRRYRAGIAWRKNSTWSFQWLYIFQRSRPNATDPFSVVDNIFSFSLIQNFK